MQRRAVAMYFAFFVIVGAAAYGLIQTTSAPAVSLEGPAHEAGDDVTIGDRTYTVSGVSGGSGQLTWVNESGVLTSSIENGSDVPVTAVQWDNQSAREETTLADGGNVTDAGTEYGVSVNGSAGTVTLTNVDDASDNVTVEAGGTFEFRGFTATVTEVADNQATVVWGNPYALAIDAANGTDPTEATFVEQRNVTQLAAADPALYDEPVRQNGTLKVTRRADDTNVPAREYFGPTERHTIAEGDALVYQGNETTVDEVGNESVTLTRPGETTTEISLAEGENVTIGGEEYFAMFPTNESVQIFASGERYGDYQADMLTVENYNERMAGLWGVAELSAIAAIILLGAALLPLKG